MHHPPLRFPLRTPPTSLKPNTGLAKYKPFNYVHRTVDEKAILIPLPEGISECYVDQPERFTRLHPVNINGTQTRILQIHNHYLVVEGHFTSDEDTMEVQITQAGPTFHQHEVFEALNEYWMPFWNHTEEDEHTFMETFEMRLPQLPPLEDNFEGNLADWKHAIRTAKATSAPGADGFSFRELKMIPDRLLAQLVKIVVGMQQFPQHLMLARTVPIPKKHELTPDNCRPITVLATLYRLWGKVCGRRCLRHFSRYMSSAITGMLPKRGAFASSYNMQAYLELQRAAHQDVTGLTLDLKKCFNLLQRSKVQRLMCAMGIPARLVQKWANSLDAMTRYWDVSKCTSHIIPTSNGCPEGDSWSVVAMLVTAETWCYLLEQQTPLPRMSAYADNWSVWTGDIHISAAPALCTSRFVDWMGLQISWDKTWIWSTSTSGAAKLKACMTEHFPATATTIKTSATDLGCQLTYHGNSKLGIVHQRFEQAKMRLEVIKQSNWALPHKSHVVQTAILPLALYGTELMPVGQKNLTSLRTAIVEAIVGEHIQTMSSAIFIQCVENCDLDPFFRAILGAVKQARRFLRSACADDRNSFLAIVSKPSLYAGHAQGPASSLREYLQRLALTCSPTGDIMVTALRTCNLIHGTWFDIRHALRVCWQSQLLMHHTQRVKLYNLPPINQAETIRLLKKYKPKQRLLLLREISGAFQTKHQQSKWNESDGLCPLCFAQTDTRQHRAFECQALQEVRMPFQEFVTQLQDINPDLVELPVLHLHPHHEFHDALLFSMPQPQLDMNMIQKVLNLGANNLTFFTDGSCKYPNCPHSRYSAFAIVCDLCPSDCLRKHLAYMYRCTGRVPETLQKLTVGRTYGRQCIHRAEMQAILVLFEQLDAFDVYTDSSTAISCIELCRNAVDIEELADHDDFDLLFRFFQVMQPSKRVHKVKAHRNLGRILDELELYRALGNQVADHLANHACSNHLPEVISQLEDFHQDLCQQKVLLQQYYDLNLRLQTARAKTADDVDDPPVAVMGDKRTLFCNWEVSMPWEFPADIGDEEVLNTAWSLQWSVAIAEWFSHCRWPLEMQEGDPGIAWAEVALSMILQQQMWLPVRRWRAGEELVIQPRSHLDAECLQTTLAEQATVMYCMVTQFFGLVQKRLIPAHITMGKVRSLYWQGHNAWSTGLSGRPQFSNQTEVYDLLQTLLMQGKGTHALPCITFHEANEQWTEDIERGLESFSERTRKAKLAMKRVRARRMDAGITH